MTGMQWGDRWMEEMAKWVGWPRVAAGRKVRTWK